MPRILIVEDSKMFATLISRKIRSDLRCDRDVAPTFKKARELIDKRGDDYFVAVLDLHLPDAHKGEVVDYVLEKNIPVIVFTGEFSDQIRDNMLAKNVVDYVVKQGGPEVVDYLIHSINRFRRNKFAKILLVDDSRTSRRSVRSLLETQSFIVNEAGDGQEALEILEENPDTKLVITDFNMPGMDGCELTMRIRKRFPKNKLAVIGLSAYGTSLMSARFLKAGASDFLTKPYLEEELYCRVNQNIEMLEYIDKIERTATIDYLTGIYNRHYTFHVGQKLQENAKRGNLDLTVALINVDNLRTINDDYSFECGDNVLKEFARILTQNFRSADVVSRFGGETFCVIATNMKKDSTLSVFERIRNTIKQTQIKCEDKTLSVTASIGVTVHPAANLDEMVKRAESLVKEAKGRGRDKVITDIRRSY